MHAQLLYESPPARELRTTPRASSAKSQDTEGASRFSLPPLPVFAASAACRVPVPDFDLRTSVYSSRDSNSCYLCWSWTQRDAENTILQAPARRSVRLWFGHHHSRVLWKSFSSSFQTVIKILQVSFDD